MLEALGGETETVIVVRESHWAVGGVEWIAIHEADAMALAKADEQCERLADYPVLNEEDWSGRGVRSSMCDMGQCRPARAN